MTNWQAATIYRPAAGGPYPNQILYVIGAKTPSLAYTQMYPMNQPLSDASNAASPPITTEGANNVVIPAHGYALLENFQAGPPISGSPTVDPNDATIRSNNSLLPNAGVFSGQAAANNTVDVYVPALHKVIQDAAPNLGGEFVLLRPRRADGTYTQNDTPSTPSAVAPPTYDPMNVYNEGTPITPNLYDLVPVDSFDFTNLAQTAAPPYTDWSYIRPSGIGTAFQATEPGQYLLQVQRQSGTASNSPSAAFIAPNVPAFGSPYLNTVASSYSGSEPTLPIQIYNQGMPGPNATLNTTSTTALPQKFPFGGFARNGDILNVPYVGAYRIRVVDPTHPDGTTGAPFQPAGGNPESTFLEMNSLPMDVSLADDGDLSDDAYENVGRFGPLASATNVPATDWYAWSSRLFDYLTVQSNNDDYLPNVDPGFNDVATDTNTGTGQPLYPYATKYWPAAQSPVPNNPNPSYTNAFANTYAASPAPALPAIPPQLPNPVYNADGAATDQTTQDNVGVEGLININTASWKVLSMLPMVTAADDTGGAQAVATDNETIAQAIVTYRNTNGPFMSIFDLNKVPGFQTANTHFPITLTTGDPGTMGVTGGGFPNGPPDANFPNKATGIYEDYRATNMVLNRISNLITTRSDTFTVYIVVEGWQNAVLTPYPNQQLPAQDTFVPPQLKVTRRFSFIADRSAINADINTRFLKTLIVPND